jgi:hypothetical protein
MRLTKRQKICAGVLLLAGLAFVVDRWVIGPGPSPAAAAAGKTGSAARISSPSAAALTRAAAASPAGNAPAPATRSLAARLMEVAQAERLELTAVPDAFRPSRRWGPAEPDTSSVAPVPGPVKSDLAGLFKSRHKLNAVMSGRPGSGGIAIIDGHMLTPGMKVDGFTLTAVTERSAVLEAPGVEPGEKHQVELYIEVPAGGKLDNP